jgi:molybdenum cofactor cytidylyltransferase
VLLTEGPLISTGEAARLPVVLVLASGRGERFIASGGTTHKLQADLGGKTVLERTLAAVRTSGLNWHLEDAGLPGMGDSIASAVRTTRNAPGWMVLPADLPLIRPQTLVDIARATVEGDVLVPVFEGQRGHPVRFAANCGNSLAILHGNQGAAQVTYVKGATKLVVSDRGCVMDIDTLGDLERARELLRDIG